MYNFVHSYIPLSVHFYFIINNTHPYSAYERGTNERMNGLIRRFIPKGKEISKISKEGIKRIMDWYNSLPRRIFDYKSSMEKFLMEIKGICEIEMLEKLLVEV